MKAVSLKNIGEVELIDIPVPTIQDDQLLIKTGAATICTSDVIDIRSNPFETPLPVILGHEAAGTVVAVGAKVKGFQVGDRVATHPVHSCGNCQACRDGLSHLCLNMEHFGLNMQGTMAEYYVVRQDRALHIPENVDFPTASLAEPVSVCLEALAQARLQPENTLLIIGDGPFGVMMTRLAEALNLGRVVIAGQQDFRLSFSGRATKINTRNHPDSLGAIKAANDGLGFDAAILAVSSQQAFAECLQSLKPKGRLVVFSALPSDTPVDLFWVHLKEIEIVGSCNDQERFADAVRMLSNPALGISKIITHRLPLAEYQQGLHLAEFERETAMKVTFIF